MTDLYENLLRATDNTANITTEKQGTITKIQDKLCNVKEEATGLEHTNVPVINEVQVKEGDTVLLGFLDNNIYNPIVYGIIGRETVDAELSNISENPVQNKIITSALNGKQATLISGTNIKTINNTSLLGSGNIDIQGGGGTGGIVMVGSFKINDDGDLIVTLPTGTLNPYHIDENGDLIYSTNPQIGGK